MAIMTHDLLAEIEEFLRNAEFGEHRFGILAARNGRLVERLRQGRRVWPDTEQRVRSFIRAQRRLRPAPEKTEEAA